MREFTKSILSFSWAMSLFGVQQTANLMSPEKAAKAFNSVTQATEGEFGDALKATFNAGDRLQRRALDQTLGLFMGETFSPNKWMRTVSGVMQQSAQALTRGAQGVTSTLRQAASEVMPSAAESAQPVSEAGPAEPGSQPESQGWGPMPS